MNRFQPKIVHYESLPSTNTEAARLASEGAAEGLSIVADEQTAGRGRMQRRWSSPRGAGLYLSVLLRPKMSLELWPLITLMTALAVSDALREACELKTDIKWPNDIISDERKLCGILAETIETPAGRVVVVGIGINLTRNSFPPDLIDTATSVEDATGHVPERDVILLSLLRAFAHWYSLLQEHTGPNHVLKTWISRSSYSSGKTVRVVNGRETIQGTTCGLEADGALRIETVRGEIKIVRAGDVVSLRSVQD